ncbi:MAG: hypothetical protein ACR652_26760 [Methylocystis sp.]|uniref:hypothetical protein n=1 Tax=Methylocystis sp. TaxID=1911079 RepID=UPI003DA34CF9
MSDRVTSTLPENSKDMPIDRNASIEITVFSKDEGILSKTIRAAEDGSPVSDASECRMSSGTAMRMPLSGVESLAALINNMAPNEALALGQLVEGVGDTAPVTTVRCLKSALKGTIARSQAFLKFMLGAPAFMLLDIDVKGMPQKIKNRIEEAGGIEAVLSELFPDLMTGERVVRASTSAGISNAATGQTFPGSGGLHIYIAVEDGSDIARALNDLNKRLWLKGYGWIHVTFSGQALIRTFVDASVGSPERLVFEGAPIVEPPLVQDHEARRALAKPGLVVDTRSAIKPLAEAEREHLLGMIAAERRVMNPKIYAARRASDERLAQEIAEREGVPFEPVIRRVRKRHQRILLPEMPLVMDDDELGTVTVADVLKNPERFVGETLADPLEGPSYGRCKAMIMHDRANGDIFVKSFAHGGICYDLRYDRQLLEIVLRESKPEHIVDIFVAKADQSDLEADDETTLIDLVAQISGVGKRPIIQRLKQERARRKHEKLAAMEAARPSSGRPVYPAPAADAEITPVVQLLDAVLSKVGGTQPPMRNLSGSLVAIRSEAPHGLHMLTSEGADAAQGNDEKPPAPKEPLIHELSIAEATMEIERHIEFTSTDKFGLTKSVRLPASFVAAYRSLHASKLPVCAAISTAPVISPHSCDAIMGDGLDRRRGVFYAIASKLRNCVPDPDSITDEMAIEAYKYLANKWLIDVTTDANGKATVIAAVLTIIQRIALNQRPAFFIVAAQRGGGKTTLASMITMAALGRAPAAAAWAPSEEERRKALLSYLRMGAAAIVWDNIPRGASIRCPHMERALTSAEYTDRVLGVSEQLTVPSLTVMLFTGNNIAPTGDMASRSLVCSIDVTRTDPENRSFKHPDPLRWTAKNRMKLMKSLYTLLLWNPYLRMPADERVEAKTRFKTWWASVGAPIEGVTALIGEPVDFGAMFAANEFGDEEVDSVATICDAINKRFADRVFAVKDFAALLDSGPAATPFGSPAEQAARKAAHEQAEALREALQAIHDVPLPPGPLPNQRVGQILGKAVGRPVCIDGKTVRLRVVHAGHAGRTYRLEEV